MSKYEPQYRGKCLHCQTIVKFEIPDSGDWYLRVIANNEQLAITRVQCPHCGKIIVTIEELKYEAPDYKPKTEYVVWPMSGGRAPASSEVPVHVRNDYDEAALVFQLSAKSSAALSRRCLQTVLREAGQTKSKDLSGQIDEVLGKLPTYIAANLDAVRNIGNFAAHVQKSTQTGIILDVEPVEAEWNLDVLDTLFDFYYVRPAIEKAKREEARALAEADPKVKAGYLTVEVIPWIAVPGNSQPG